MPAKVIDRIGMRYGRLVVIERSPRTKGSRQARWKCRCDCGAVTTASGSCLRLGSVKSCGCLRRDAKKTHGHTKHNIKPTEYTIWINMRRRCHNPNDSRYADYGGRGISVCERWQRFDNFIADMGQRPSSEHSLDRIDVNGDYEPSNCRWSTPIEQSSNRRNNIYVECDGETTTLTEYCRRKGLRYRQIATRIQNLGWPIELAVSVPVGSRKKLSDILGYAK